MNNQEIRILESSVAQKIAAGEVVERPFSVVKELVENSIDAGASSIVINLDKGGKNRIEITDNGRGMSPIDLELCLERHATSKVRTLSDLERLGTLGFRGEALPSVSAVSGMEIITRPNSAGTTYRISAPLGTLNPRMVEEVTFGRFLSAEHGTRIRVDNIFSQVPARLKFLKSSRSESSTVSEWILRLALAYPEVGFILNSDEREILNLPATTENARVKSVLTDDPHLPIKHSEFEIRGMKIRAYWIAGLSLSSTRRLMQTVNRRPVRDRMIQQAMLQPFRQNLLPGKFPAIALYIELSPEEIDVNVHPTKTEVRFLDTSKLYEGVNRCLESFAHSPTSGVLNSGAFPRSNLQSSLRSSLQTSFSRESALTKRHPDTLQFDWKAQAEVTDETDASPTSETSPISLPESFNFARYIGVFFQTYLVYERERTLILVDQHAAHERIRYEKLKAQCFKNAEKSSQLLVLPETISDNRLTPHSMPLAVKVLSGIGFEVEAFGSETLLVRGIPQVWGDSNIRLRLTNLIETLLDEKLDPDKQINEMLLDEALFEKLASEACHSAVRAHDYLSDEKAKSIVSELFDCEHPWNCPHGRPTIIEIPQGRLEEWFQRKV